MASGKVKSNIEVALTNQIPSQGDYLAYTAAFNDCMMGRSVALVGIAGSGASTVLSAFLHTLRDQKVNTCVWSSSEIINGDAKDVRVVVFIGSYLEYKKIVLPNATSSLVAYLPPNISDVFSTVTAVHRFAFANDPTSEWIDGLKDALSANTITFGSR